MLITEDKKNIPANLSNKPMPITGAIVQKEFQNKRYVYSNTLDGD